MSIETFDNETLPPNGHTLAAWGDGIAESAPKLSHLRDALDGARVLAALVRRDTVIADLHESSAFDLRQALIEGVPFDPDTRAGLAAALCVCLDVANGIAFDMIQEVCTGGSVGLAGFVRDDQRAADMPPLRSGKAGAP